MSAGRFESWLAKKALIFNHSPLSLRYGPSHLFNSCYDVTNIRSDHVRSAINAPKNLTKFYFNTPTVSFLIQKLLLFKYMDEYPERFSDHE